MFPENRPCNPRKVEVTEMALHTLAEERDQYSCATMVTGITITVPFHIHTLAYKSNEYKRCKNNVKWFSKICE